MTTSVTLTELVPTTSYLLAYALPLLVFSLVLSFAGAFFTVDRSRSFVPNRQLPPVPGSYYSKSKQFRLYLEGGIGGILIGYCFGLHVSTFLSLLIPNESSAAALGAKSFVAVWLLSSIPAAVLAGRFKHAALAFTGITGGISLSLGLSVSFHPALLTRRILVALLIPVLTLLTLLPFDKVQHHFIRLSASATGVFGLIISIALMAHVSSWANIWDRWWLSDGEDWGTDAEHGLSAAFWLILVLGCAADFTLNRYLGGNPDEKWDSYLADYATSLPNSSDRAGTFQPVTSSFWSRILRPARSAPSPLDQPPFPATTKDPLSPTDSPPSFSATTRDYSTEKGAVFEFEKKPGMLRKSPDRPLARLMALTHSYASESTKSHGLIQGGRKREAIKFRPLSHTDELSSDDDLDSQVKMDDVLSLPPPQRHPSNRTASSKTLSTGFDSRTMSKPTAELLSFSPSSEASFEADGRRKKSRVLGTRRTLDDDPVPEYSDGEEDVTAGAPIRRDFSGRSSPFTSRHRDIDVEVLPLVVPMPPRQMPHPPTPPVGAVPMTASLMYALDRVAVAQKDALNNTRDTEPAGLPVATNPPLSLPKSDASGPSGTRVGQRWDYFWKDVTEKASEGARR